jgi:DNA-binding NtrC family response regulator
VARILIVDDDERDRLVIHLVLDEAGHEVVSLSSGDAAGSALDDGFDLVVTDLRIPDLQGYELIKSLEGLAPRPRVIALSGPGTDRLRFAARLTAATTLRKPVDPDRLVAAVEQELAD